MDGQGTIGKRGRHNPEFKKKMAAMRALAEPALDDADSDAPSAANGADRAPIDSGTPSLDAPPVTAASIVVPDKTPAGVTPNTPAAIDFLRRWAWATEGQVVLVAIPAEGGQTETRTFGFEEREQCEVWLSKHNGKLNLYFTVNEVRGRVTIKPSKADVEALTHLHADLDLKPDEDRDEGLARTLAALRGHEPPPTVIVFSGGGHQGFWKLAEPVPIDDPERIPELEAYSRQLEVELEADHCHNVDRIMRLVGTVNVPGRIKRKRGRVPVLAMLVEWHDDRVYSLTDFKAATAKANGEDRTASAQVKVDLSDLPSEVDVEKLPIDDRCKSVITNGNDFERSFKSRSHAVWFVTCELVRAGVEDKEIASVLLDKTLGISAHVRGQGDKRRTVARTIARARRSNGQVVLKTGAPMPSAEAFVARRYTGDDGRDLLLHHNDDFLAWRGSHYANVEDKTLRAQLYRFLTTAVVFDKDGNEQPFDPTKHKVENVLDALKAEVHKPRDELTPPSWLDGDGPPPDEILACANGLLHLPTGRLLSLTSRFFTRNAVDFAYDADAPEPERWLAFQRELWPDDDEAIGTLQEVFGYMLIADTSQQKLFAIIGPRRSGKSTIGAVLRRLVGAANVAGPTLSSLGTDFGLSMLIAKQLAIIADARISKKMDQGKLNELLLKISGGDFHSIDRKYKSAWEGELPTRIVILSNELPRLTDASGTLASRFVMLRTSVSFFDREDVGLLKKLLPELPGILIWAIEGWRRLRERGHFVRPGSSEDLMRRFEDLQSPVLAFVRDRCTLEGDGLKISRDALFDAWCGWCRDQGRSWAGTKEAFGADLAEAFPEVKMTRPRSGEGVGKRRVRYYTGIDIVASDPDPDELPF